MPRFYTAYSNEAVTGSAPLVKTGAGTLWLMCPSNNTFSGDITVGVDGGTLRIGGNTIYAAGTGRTGTTLPDMDAGDTITVRRGGIFYIQDNASGTAHYIANRLGSEGDRPALRLEGGTFTYNGLNAAWQMTQSVGQVTLASGYSIIYVNRTHASSTPKLICDSLAVLPGAYMALGGTAFGTLVDKVSQLYFTTPPAMVGGGGDDGSPAKSIVPGVCFGNDFVTYGPYGIRALTTAEYKATGDINTAGDTDNVKFSSGALAALAGNKTVNSLAIIGGTSPWNMGAGNTLTLTSGQFISVPNMTVAQGALTAGGGTDTDLVIVQRGGTLYLNANIVDNGSGKVQLVKTGNNTMYMQPASDNTYSGGTVISDGTVNIGTVGGRRYFGTGSVRVNGATLNLSATNATANNNPGDDYTAVNAAQINLSTLLFTGDDTFNIESGSVLYGATSSTTPGLGLNSLSRGSNVTLADGAVIAHNYNLSAPLNLDTATIKDLGTGADVLYGLGQNQNNAGGSVTVGSGTPFKGVSTDRTTRGWYQGTIDVAAGTTDFDLQGLTFPGATPVVLYLGNGKTTSGVPYTGAPVISMNGSGTVNAHVKGYVTLDDDQSVFGDTSAGEVVNFVVETNAYLVANREGAMGTGTGVATATVKQGGTMTTVALANTINNPWAALGGDVTVEAGGRLVLLATHLGLTGAGALTFKTGSILDIQSSVAFFGPQAAAATFEPGVIVRLNADTGSATDPLDNYLGDASPVFEVYGNNRSVVNPIAAGTTIMTLNRSAGGLGGMLVNDYYSRTFGAAPNGVIAIGPNGGVIASTYGTTLTVSQPIALSSNELVIGSTESFDWVSGPKLGRVDLTASLNYNTATNGSRITVLPGAELRNAVNSLPDLTEVAVGGAFYASGDTIGSLTGTGLVTVAGTLTTGRNNADTAFPGVLAGSTSVALYKTGSGKFDLTGDQNSFRGTVRVNGGELALSGNSSLTNTGDSAFTLVENGVLHLDNSGVNLTNRLGLVKVGPGVVFNGGTLRFTGKDGEASSETLGKANFALNASTIEIINGSGAGSSSELIFSALASGTPVGTLNLTAQNGTLGLAGDNPRVKMAGLTANSIIGFASVDGAPAFYDSILGFRAYTLAESTEFNGNVDQSKITNILFTAANVTPGVTNASRTVKSLWIDSPGSGKFLDVCSHPTKSWSLTLSSGRLHLTGTDDFEIIRSYGTGSLTVPTCFYPYIDEPGTTLTLSAPVNKVVYKSGPGTLKINTAVPTGIGLVINEGPVTYGAAGDWSPTATLQTWNDGRFDIAGKAPSSGTVIEELGAVTLYAGGITNSDESVPSELTVASLTMGSGPAGSSAFVDMGTNGTLILKGNVTYNTYNDPDPAYIRGKAINLNGVTRTFAVNDSVAPSAWIDLDIPATITGAAGFGITKTGSGTLRLSGANTFDGPVNITGTLRIAHPQALGVKVLTHDLTVNGSSSLVLDNANGDFGIPPNYNLKLNSYGNAAFGPVSGAIVNLAGDNSLSGAITLNGGTTLASLSGTLALTGDMTGNQTLTVQGDGDVLLSGARGGTSSLTKNGAGTLTLTGASSFSGAVTLNAGVLNVHHNTALGTVGGGVSTAIGSELRLHDNITIGNEALTLRGTGLSNSGALRNISGINTYGGKVTLGLTDVRINADAGKLIFDVASGNGFEGGSCNVLFGGAGDIEVADPIATGTGNLTKDGSGMLTLKGLNTYVGPTTVDEGTLRVTGSMAAGSAVTVKDGAVLEGTGTCSGTTTVPSGATLAPGLTGTAGGTLSIATLNLEAGSICAFELAATPDPANDKLAVTGSGKLTIAPGTGIALVEPGTDTTCTRLGTYSLIQYVGTLNGSVENLAVLNPDNDVLYTFFTEGNWIKVLIESARVSALAASNLTPSSGQMNGQVLDVGATAEAPSVWFCWDTSDKGMSATGDWAHAEYVGEYAKGQPFSKVQTGLLSGSNYTYRVFAENSSGPAWSPEAISFKPVYLPTVVNTGARGVNPGVTLLQGEVTDTGSEAPNVWFLYWKVGDATTNVVDVGIQAAACDTEISGLPQGASYAYMLKATNQAGTSYSGVFELLIPSDYYVALSGNDENDGLSWGTALLNIQTAVTKSQDGDTIHVGDGMHGLTNTVNITKGIKLLSLNGRDATAIGYTNINDYSFRLIYINNPYAVVSGHTVTNGRATLGGLNRDKATGNGGGGVRIGPLGGTLQDCRITACMPGWHGTGHAIYMVTGLVTRCVIENNPCDNGGNSSIGTVLLENGLIENCLIRNNQAHMDGGGLLMSGGTARNCTIVDNSTQDNISDFWWYQIGSGVFLQGNAVLQNCIVWGNIVSNHDMDETRNLYMHNNLPKVINCCAESVKWRLSPSGTETNTITGNPILLSDYTLCAGSPCIDAGSNSVDDAASDFFGNDRVSGPSIDIGCHEYDQSIFSCGFYANPQFGGMGPAEVTLHPAVYGTETDPSLLEYVWTIKSASVYHPTPTYISGTGLLPITRTWNAGGYTVTLAVTDPATSSTTSLTVTNAFSISAQKMYVAKGNINAAMPYDTLKTAAADLWDALDLATDGTEIEVWPGTYDISKSVLLNKAITMRGVRGWTNTIIRGPADVAVRYSGDINILKLAHADALVDGFTLTGGQTAGGEGGGVQIDAAGGTLLNCRVTGNHTSFYTSGAGIAMRAGRVDRCIVDNNAIDMDSLQGQGIALYGGIVENSLIIDNHSFAMLEHWGYGGGVAISGGVLRNCTIVGNSCSGSGGVHRNGGLVQNCIIWGNETTFDYSPGKPNWGGNETAAFWQNVCTPVSIGTGCITTDPAFVDVLNGNYRLRPESMCLDGGVAIEGLGDKDMGGDARVSGPAVDVGAYERDSNGLGLGIVTTPSKGTNAVEVALWARVYGMATDTNLLEYTWVLDDAAGTPVASGTGLAGLTHTYDVPGYYNVRLTVHDPVTETTAVAVRTNAVYIAPETIYVVQENSQAQQPYDTWAKAATNIHHAMAGALGGVTVLISNGTYAVTEQIRLTEAITLRGVNGYGVTRLQGNKVFGVRILNMSHANALVEGLTIAGGMAERNGPGSGVCIQANGGTLRRCWITDNDISIYTYGGGVYMMPGSLVEDCLISSNGSRIVDVEYQRNSYGGGAFLTGGVLRNCVIRDNSLYQGGGVYMANGGEVINCTITENYASYYGAGGVYRANGTIRNCIIWGNDGATPTSTGNPNWQGSSAAFYNCCTPVAVGSNCQTGDPNFRNAAAQDYRLRRPSSCTDTGVFQSWMVGKTDFLGNPRIDVGSKVDIGAIENQSGRAIRLILR